MCRLSLMRNQIASDGTIGIKAETINSTNQTHSQPMETALRRREFDVLLTPERLANDDFVNRCLLPIANRVGLFIVDEAHGISDWGHDFHPNYRRIVRILRALPHTWRLFDTKGSPRPRGKPQPLSCFGSHDLLC